MFAFSLLPSAIFPLCLYYLASLSFMISLASFMISCYHHGQQATISTKQIAPAIPQYLDRAPPPPFARALRLPDKSCLHWRLHAGVARFYVLQRSVPTTTVADSGPKGFPIHLSRRNRRRQRECCASGSGTPKLIFGDELTNVP